MCAIKIATHQQIALNVLKANFIISTYSKNLCNTNRNTSADNTKSVQENCIISLDGTKCEMDSASHKGMALNCAKPTNTLQQSTLKFAIKPASLIEKAINCALQPSSHQQTALKCAIPNEIYQQTAQKLCNTN